MAKAQRLISLTVYATEEHKQVIERAAQADNRSTSNFLLAAALERAYTLGQSRPFREDDLEVAMDANDAASSPSDAAGTTKGDA